MVKLLPRIILALIFWGVFTYVIFNVAYPKSITDASFFQLIFFFVPLFLSLIFTLNIFLNFLHSFFISSGIILLLILKALNILNFVSATLTILTVYFFISYFSKTKLKFKSPELSKIRLLKNSEKSKLQPLKKLGRK